jgi:hypothetical protein
MLSIEDPFDTAQVLSIPDLEQEGDFQWHGFRPHFELKNNVFTLPELEGLSLPDTKPTQFALDLEEVSVPSLDDSSSSSYETANEDEGDGTDDRRRHEKHEELETLGPDIWQQPEIAHNAQKTNLTSWDHFANKTHAEPPVSLLSEAGDAIFDAVFNQSGLRDEAAYIHRNKFLVCLSALVHGRSSLLFQWDETAQTFVVGLGSISISGYTPNAVLSIVDAIIPTSTVLKKLSEPALYYLKSNFATRPSVIAFQSVLSSCLAAIHRHLDDGMRHLSTCIDIHRACAVTQPLIQLLEKVVILAVSSQTNHDFISSVFDASAGLSLQFPRFKALVDEIAASVGESSLQRLGQDIGLGSKGLQGQIEHMTRVAEPENLPLPLELRQIVSESQATIELLRADDSDALAAVRSDNVNLRLAFSWTTLLEVQTEALNHERDVRSKLRSLHGLGPQHVTISITHGAANMGTLRDQTDPFKLFDLAKALPNNIVSHDLVYSTALRCLDCAGEAPVTIHIGYEEVLNYSLLPTFAAQHRLLSYSIFRTLFSKHNILSHLRLQQRIHLLADGMFAARLQIALFDSEQVSGETQRKTGATTGLRLQARDTWPPASSELRLVLMGLLSESLRSTNSVDLEQTISFAMRELSNDHLDLCRDVNSIYALDFLRIQYKAPTPIIAAIISDESLEKYDKIFKHLLLVLRLQSVTKNLSRMVSSRHVRLCDGSAARFHSEMHQFIAALAAYTQGIAIGRHWAVFEQLMFEVSLKLEEQDYEGALKMGHSLHYLKSQHEYGLDSVLHALFLRNKQRHLLEILHEIAGVILAYAATTEGIHGNEADARQHHDRFRQLCRTFVASLLSMVGGTTATDGNGSAELTNELLTLLNFNGYWGPIK